MELTNKDLGKGLSAKASDDALASGVPAGEGGFDPSKTQAARLLQRAYEVVHHNCECPSIRGNGDTDCQCDAVPFLHDLKKFVAAFPTVPPTPAGDMAGEDDAAFVERMATDDGWYNRKPLDRERLIALARKGARREPVAGDGWQPIETAPRTHEFSAIIATSGGFVAEAQYRSDDGLYSEGDAGWWWANTSTEYGGVICPEPTHWRPLPAAPGVDACALPPAASPNGAGLGSEPVAWKWKYKPAVAVVTEGLHIVFDGPPGPVAGRFVEVETPGGRGVNAGDWREREDGYWELVLTAAAFTQKGQK